MTICDELEAMYKNKINIQKEKLNVLSHISRIFPHIRPPTYGKVSNAS